MTVCIASVAQRGSAIVFASDQMADLASVSADFVMSKVDFLTPFWVALWAGDDTTAIPPIIRRARAALEPHARDATVDRVADAVASSYRLETQERATAEILSIYDIDMRGFVSQGQNSFGETAFSLMQQRLEQFDLGNLEVLVCGFAELGPTIFTVGRGGTVRYYDRLGFWAIGSGNHLAASSLAFRGQNSIKPLDETIYNVCEAKFRAESIRSVGKTTTVGLLRRQHGPMLMPMERIALIKSEWEQYMKPPIPDGALNNIRDWLAPGAAPISSKGSQSHQRSKRGRKRQPPSPE